MQKTVSEYLASNSSSGPQCQYVLRQGIFMNPMVKYNEFTLGLEPVDANKKLILCLHTSSWSLKLILCEFEVHMSNVTTTSPAEGFKLPLEMIIWS